jgi:hypothetical protein
VDQPRTRNLAKVDDFAAGRPLRAAGKERRINSGGEHLRVLNEVRRTRLGETREGPIEGLVRVRGFEGVAAGRSFGFQRYDPEAVVLRREDDIRRVPFPAAVNNAPAAAVPVGIYLAVRLLLRRRRRR